MKDILLGLIIFSIGAALLYVLFLGIHAGLSSYDWPTIQTQVIASEKIDPTEKGKEPYAQIRYRYTVDKKSYQPVPRSFPRLPVTVPGPPPASVTTAR